MMVCLGYPDGEFIPWNEFLAAIRRISRVVSIPLSTDLVSGFGNTVKEVVSSTMEVIQAGAVGINLEDLKQGDTELIAETEQCRRISALKDLSEEIGVPFVINARTDAISHRGKSNLETSIELAIKRSQAYIEAGADCVYPMGLTDMNSIVQFVNAVKFPVNIMIRKGIPEIKALRRIGVTRFSFGPSAIYAVMGMLLDAGKEIIEHSSFTKLIERAIDYEMLNSLAARRK